MALGASALLAAIAVLFAGCSREPTTPPSSSVSDEWHPVETASAPEPHPAANTATEPIQPDGPVALKVESGTKGMVALLAKIRELSARTPSIYQNAERAADLKKVLEHTTDPTQAVYILGDYATELLRSGRSEEAAAAFTQLEKDVKKHTPEFYAKQRIFLKIQTAVAYMRMGEQQNCLAHHSNESCLFPITGGGLHQKTEGSTEAMRLLLEVLKEQPDNVPAAWLLNIAAMTLGNYPAGVPEAFRLPAEALKSDHDIGRFTDVAHHLGIGVNELAGGVVMEDFNNDGFLDLMLSSWSLEHQLRLFMNRGDGSFEDRTDTAGLTGITGGLNMVQADFNNDGHMDVFVLRGAWREKVGTYPNSLLRNNGDGTFEDVTKEAKLLSLHPTQSAVWFDYDNDGWIDLFIANESQGPLRNPCELYRNRGDGTFGNIAAACGVNFVGFFKSVVAGDFNNDGRCDLYLSELSGANKLLRNDGPSDDAAAAAFGVWKFTDVADIAGVSQPKHSFPSWFFDYDNDGWLDLFVSDYNIGAASAVTRQHFGMEAPAEQSRLYRNLGDGSFEDVSAAMGIKEAMLTMGSNFGDLDNDGWLDFYLGTGAPDLSFLFPNRMFRNNAGKGFQDVTTSGGFGHLQKGHGVAFGDLDNDGDQDVYAVMGGAYSGDNYFNALFQNPGHGGNWIKLRLKGQKTNRAAIGARLKLTIVENEVERAIHRVVGSGGSFGASPLLQEIGLGSAPLVKRLEITWPTTGKTQSFDNLAAGWLHKIVEGESEPDSSRPASIAFGHKH